MNDIERINIELQFIALQQENLSLRKQLLAIQLATAKAEETQDNFNTDPGADGSD